MSEPRESSLADLLACIAAFGRSTCCCLPSISCALGAKMGKGDVRLGDAARAALLTYRWPGNIRELQNAIERALIVSDGTLITAEHLGIGGRREASGDSERSAPPPSTAGIVPSQPPRVESLAELEKRAIADALAAANGNKSRAAAVSRRWCVSA